MDEKKYRVYVCGNLHCLMNGKHAIVFEERSQEPEARSQKVLLPNQGRKPERFIAFRLWYNSTMDEKKYRVYVCGNIHCLANGKHAILRALEEAVWQHGLDAEVDVRVSGCQNQCDFGPNMKIWPGPYQYIRLSPEAVERIVVEHLRDGKPVTEFLLA